MSKRAEMFVELFHQFVNKLDDYKYNNQKDEQFITDALKCLTIESAKFDLKQSSNKHRRKSNDN